MPNVIAVDFFGSQSPSNQMADRSFSNSLVLRVPANSWAPCSSRDRQPRLLQSRGVLKIGGCFAFWHWIRRGGSPYVVILGIASLIGFAVTLTRLDSAFAGRAYAAYGGIYIAASLLWLWLVEGQAPTRTDILGACMAIAGALVIISFAQRAR